MLYSLFALLLAAAIIKIIQLKKAAREISAAFADRLQTDTNTQIDISSRDKDMCRLASAINTQLRILRQEHLRYHQGDTELKNAVTNISHDLRTPLTAICGYLDMMEKTEISEQQARYLGIIKKRAELMKQLTEELFRYSVIVSDDEKTETETILINQVLEDSIMGYYAVLTEKGIHPDVNITDKQIMAELNKEYLSRIFSNLLNNAVKYSDGDLDIILSDTGEIIFSNTAKGLSAVDAEQLFDRFYTVEAAHHSTGLGLSIARTLVRRMGGTITGEYADSRLKIKIKF